MSPNKPELVTMNYREGLMQKMWHGKDFAPFFLLKLPMADSIIYATAKNYNATLWTQDVDFKGMPDVNYIPQN